MESLCVITVKQRLHLLDFTQKQKKQPGCAKKSIYPKLVLTRERSVTLSEKSESKRIGAKQHKNSGRNTQKGDASWKNFVVDFKEVGKSFTLNKEVWAKATTDAMKNGKDPAIVVVMGEGNSKVRLAIIEMSILEDLVEE
jgi:outer membrane phospholipase A